VNLVNGALDAETSHGGPRARGRSTASSFVIQCIDDLVQPHQNAKDDVRGHVRENGHTNFRKASLRYLNPITF
jgi:hypothetical protein